MTDPVQPSNAHHADHVSLPVLLNALRLPAVKRLWPEFCECADKEGWPARRLLASLCDVKFQLDERAQRRIQRHLAEARLPQGKTLESFDFAAVPTVAHARARALVEGDEGLQEEKNLLAFGPPGIGKTHLVAAIGYELVHRGYRVPEARDCDLIQRLQGARQELALTQEIAKLSKFDLVILDHITYVRKDQAESSALFEFIAARYECQSIAITENRPFGQLGDILPEPAMTVAAIDRLVHHATLFEMNVESYRRRQAQAAQPAATGADASRKRNARKQPQEE